MKSHEYQFRLADVLQLTGPLLLVVLVFAGFMHLGTRLHLLPRPRPTHDLDHTILIHQAETARQSHPADLVLLGDSSCMMDASAKSLGEQLHCTSLNLGLVSYVDVTAYARMLLTYAKANPGCPRAVVLLMHPEALRRPGPDPRYVVFLQSALQGDPPNRLGESVNPFNAWVGVDTFRSSFLSRWVPAPLPGNYGKRYGFTADVERFLDANHGSLFDPDPQKFQGNAEYRLARQLEAASRAFKAALPANIKLYAAITPVPAGFPPSANYVSVHAQMLKQWSQWLGAEPLPLPATLPDRMFKKTTHLNEEGVQVYTEQLAKSLRAAGL
jgi:hypothetical protein